MASKGTALSRLQKSLVVCILAAVGVYCVAAALRGEGSAQNAWLDLGVMNLVYLLLAAVCLLAVKGGAARSSGPCGCWAWRS